VIERFRLVTQPLQVEHGNLRFVIAIAGAALAGLAAGVEFRSRSLVGRGLGGLRFGAPPLDDSHGDD